VSTENVSKHPMFRWTSLKGLISILAFFILTIIVEYLIVLLALSLGIQDHGMLQWSNPSFTLTISPLFHLVPLSVTLALTACWIYLTKHVKTRPQDMQKIRPGTSIRRGRELGKQKNLTKVKHAFSRINVFAYVDRRIRSTRPTVRSALGVFAAFLALILVVVLLAFPNLIFESVTNAYRNNPGLLNFVRGTGQALSSSVGRAFSSLNDAVLAGSTGFRNFAYGVGNLISPLANADNEGRYLFFQNAAAWICALVVLFHGEFRSKTYKYTKK